MSLESIGHLRSAGPSRFSRSSSAFKIPPASVVRSRYMDIMAPHRSRMYDRAYVTIEEKSGQEELTTARARRETIASEVQAALHRVQEGESLLQSLRTEVLEAQLRLREADEHIGFIRDFLQKQKLYRLTQAPVSGPRRPKSPLSPTNASVCSHDSSGKLDEWLDADGSSSEKSQIDEERSKKEGLEPLSDTAVLKEDRVT